MVGWRLIITSNVSDGCANAVAFKLHCVVRGLIFNDTDHMLMVVVSLNMAQLLFGDEKDLLNNKTRMVKHQLLAKYNGRSSYEVTKDIEMKRKGRHQGGKKISTTTLTTLHGGSLPQGAFAISISI